MKYVFSKEEIAEIQESRRKNRDKNVERRLKALELKAEGRTGQEIVKMTGYHSGYIPKLAAKYRSGGIEAITRNHYGGNHRNMTHEEETEFLCDTICNLSPDIIHSITARDWILGCFN